MAERIMKYRFSAPQIFTGEMIITYRNGYLNGIEGIRLIGNRWDNMCINKPIPFKENDIARIKEEHGNKIFFKQMRDKKPEISDSHSSNIRMNGIL